MARSKFPAYGPTFSNAHVQKAGPVHMWLAYFLTCAGPSTLARFSVAVRRLPRLQSQKMGLPFEGFQLVPTLGHQYF